MKPPAFLPDPAELTDEEILEVANKLTALAQRVAGCVGQPVAAADVEALDPASRYLFKALHVQVQILNHENKTRATEGERLVAEIEDFLGGAS